MQGYANRLKNFTRHYLHLMYDYGAVDLLLEIDRLGSFLDLDLMQLFDNPGAAAELIPFYPLNSGNPKEVFRLLRKLFPKIEKTLPDFD